MSKPEFRVRPVVRHVVTRFEPAEMGQNKVETLGEFDNESYAEIVREALAERVADRPKQYVVVERSFDLNVMAVYADYLGIAEIMKKELEAEHGREFRIFERELTDPMAIARVGLQTEAAAVAGYVGRKGPI